MDWRDHARMGWDLLSWEGEAQWFCKSRTGWTSGGRLRGFDALLSALRNAEMLRWNFFLNVNPVCQGVKYASRRDILRWRYLVLDLDGGQFTDSPPEVGDWLTGAQVSTGRGWQFWLPLDQTLPPPEWAERAMRQRLTQDKGADIAPGWKIDFTCTDLPRRVRCPGSINQRSGRRCEVIAMPTGRASWQALEGMAPPPPVVQEVPELRTENLKLKDALPHLNISNRQFVLHGWEAPGRHSECWALIKRCHELGIPHHNALRWALHGASLCTPEPLPDGEVLRRMRQVYGG